jgi:hypothetical protein
MRRRDPLIAQEHAATAAALLTAVGGLLAWMISAGVQLDGRIDKLEQATRILLGPDGQIVPAPESVEAKYHAQALEREVARLHHRLELVEQHLLNEGGRQP